MPGSRYELQATEDLRTWTTIWISALAVSSDAFSFVDTTRTLSGKRFYRVRMVEAAFASLAPVRLDIAKVVSPIRGTQLSFPAMAGLRYAVQTTEDLRTWTTLWSTPVVTVNRSYSIVDTAQTASRRRFYRLQIGN